MKKWIVGAIVLVLVLGGVYVAFQSGTFNASAGERVPDATEEIKPVRAPREVIAEARVVPVRYSALSMPVSGIVDEVLVAEQDQVLGGQVLVYLRNGRERAAVAEAEATLRAAQARLEELKSGPRSQEIASSRAGLDAAEAELARLREPPRHEDLAASEASLTGAQAALEDLLAGADEDELARALADRANAKAALQQAQFAYDQVKWDAGIQARPESVELQRATNEFEAASARYQELAKGPSEADVAGANARVRQVQAELDRLKSPARASEIDAAEAQVRRAGADLDLLEVGNRLEEISKAEADVMAAEAGLAGARVALSETELRAPFSGIVASLDARVGEPVDPSRAVVRLADVSQWQIETDDLTEIEVVNVREGAPVTITFDAISDLELPGRVARIRPFGEEKQGDMTYTVLIQPDHSDQRLRWNMTALVNIEPQESTAEGDKSEAPTGESTAEGR